MTSKILKKKVPGLKHAKKVPIKRRTGRPIKSFMGVTPKSTIIRLQYNSVTNQLLLEDEDGEPINLPITKLRFEVSATEIGILHLEVSPVDLNIITPEKSVFVGEKGKVTSMNLMEFIKKGGRK